MKIRRTGIFMDITGIGHLAGEPNNQTYNWNREFKNGIRIRVRG